jgi:hypothetical protein
MSISGTAALLSPWSGSQVTRRDRNGEHLGKAIITAGKFAQQQNQMD